MKEKKKRSPIVDHLFFHGFLSKATFGYKSHTLGGQKQVLLDQPCHAFERMDGWFLNLIPKRMKRFAKEREDRTGEDRRLPTVETSSRGWFLSYSWPGPERHSFLAIDVRILNPSQREQEIENKIWKRQDMNRDGFGFYYFPANSTPNLTRLRRERRRDLFVSFKSLVLSPLS